MQMLNGKSGIKKVFIQFVVTHLQEENQILIKIYGRIIIDTGVAANGDLALINIDDGELTMIGTIGIVNGQQKKYRPNLYEDQSIQVKDFFDSVQAVTKNDMPTQSKSKSQPQPQYQSQSQSQSTLDIYTQSTYTPQIRDIPAKKSYITAFKEMQARMENGECPTQDDMKILWELSSKTLDSDSYSYDEEQSRLDLLNWGGITPQLKTLYHNWVFPFLYSL